MFKKSNIENKNSFNFGGGLCLAATVYFIYYLLIKDNFLPSSVSSVLSLLSERHFHILGVALVPIFLGLMIFGASVVSIYLGSAVQRWLSKFLP